MSFNSETPVIFAGVSSVTSSRGSKDPELGVRVSKGGNQYIYVYNAASASDAYPGMGMTLINGATNYSCTISTTAGLDQPVGVVQNATIAAGSYGWLLTKGIGTAYTSAAIAAGTSVQIAANGLWTTGATFTVGKLLAVTSAATNITGSAYFAL